MCRITKGPLFIFLSLFNFILREKQTHSVTGGGEGGAGRDRIPSRVCPVSTGPEQGLSLTDWEIMTWAEIKSLVLNRLIHPGVPVKFIYFGRERETERERESQSGSALSVQSLMQGSNSCTCEIMTWPKSRVRCLTN